MRPPIPRQKSSLSRPSGLSAPIVSKRPEVTGVTAQPDVLPEPDEETAAHVEAGGGVVQRGQAGLAGQIGPDQAQAHRTVRPERPQGHAEQQAGGDRLDLVLAEAGAGVRGAEEVLHVAVLAFRAEPASGEEAHGAAVGGAVPGRRAAESRPVVGSQEDLCAQWRGDGHEHGTGEQRARDFHDTTTVKP